MLSQAQSPRNECLGVYFSPRNTDDEFQGRPMAAVTGLEMEMLAPAQTSTQGLSGGKKPLLGSEGEAPGASQPMEQSNQAPKPWPEGSSL